MVLLTLRSLQIRGRGVVQEHSGAMYIRFIFACQAFFHREPPWSTKVGRKRFRAPLRQAAEVVHKAVRTRLKYFRAPTWSGISSRTLRSRILTETPTKRKQPSPPFPRALHFPFP